MIRQIPIQIAILIIMIFFSCSSNRYNYVDKTYDHEKQLKTIYLCPILALDFDNRSQAYIKHVQKLNMALMEDSLRVFLNENLHRLSLKYLNKKHAVLSPASFKTINLPQDSSEYVFFKIYNKKDSSITVKFPNNNILIKNGIHCNYALFLTDVLVYKTVCSGLKMYFLWTYGIPAPSNDPSYSIKGNYILWDYDKNSAICGGDFDDNFNTTDVWNKNTILEVSYSFCARILAKSKYWNISNLYSEEKESHGEWER